MKNIKYLLLALLTLQFSAGFSQFLPKYVQSGVIKVVNQSNVPLLNPFAGGLMFPTFTNIDLNGDGKQDIIILDRADEQILTFINQSEGNNIKFLYVPSWEKYFPDTLSRFIFLKDYNLDGKADLYSYATFNPSGFEIYKNTGTGGKLRFEKVIDQIQTIAGWNPSLSYNLYVTSTDIPAIVDLDGDGDLDILTYDMAGGAWLEYYQNMSQDSFHNSDSFNYSKNDEYWGYFMEDPVNNGVYLGYVRTWGYKQYKMENGYSAITPKRHIGSTCIVEDMDGDGDKDEIVGDVSYPGIIMLKNGKTEFHTHYDTMIAQVKHYPASKPVHIRQMPCPFYQDVTGDNVKDLIFSPMDEGTADTFQSLHHVWLYKNTGTDSTLNPVFVQDDFLIDQMIQTGGATYPAFFDYDADGDNDLFVATKGNYPYTFYKHDRIMLYENIGKKDSNIFRLKDSNYLNLYPLGYESLSLAFGDIDGDGVNDLLLGSKTGKFSYYHNSALVGQPASFNLVSTNFQGISMAGGYSTAAIACIDKDSLCDIIAAGYYGNLLYYRNTGTKLNPVFTLENDTFCGINIPGGEHYMAAAIADLDANGKPDLLLSFDRRSPMTGIYSSKLNFYYNITDNPDSTYQPRDSMISYIENGILSKSTRAVGKRVKPALADLDGDGFPDLVLGSQRGGLMFFGTNVSCITKIIPLGPTVLCPGDSLKLDAGANFDSYLWNNGKKTRYITVKTGGNISCTVTKGALSYTANITVTVHPGTVVADFAYTKMATNLTYSFETGNKYIDSIYWDFGDGSHSYQLNPVHTFAKADTFRICMFIRDSCGASNTKCIKIKTTGMKEIAAIQMVVFPNPFSSYIFVRIDHSASKNLELRLTDLSGKNRIEMKLDNDLNTINTAQLTSGIYLLSVVDQNGKMVYRRKFIKF